jgi:hypothetical protein
LFFSAAREKKTDLISVDKQQRCSLLSSCQQQQISSREKRSAAEMWMSSQISG